MKQVFTFIIAIVLFTPLFSQEEKPVPEIPKPVETQKDTNTMRVNGKKIIVISDVKVEDEDENENHVISIYADNRSRVWQGFEIGFTGVSYSPDFNTTVPSGSEFFEPIIGKSINWAINPFEMDIRIADEYIKFSTGLGYTARNFDLENNYRLTKDKEGNTVGFQDTKRTLVRNRFRTGYITIPAILFFNTSKNPQKAFRIGAGVVGGVKIFEAYRVKHYENGHRTREKYNGGYNANPFILDLRAIIGFGNVNIYATYATQTLFDSGKGPQVYPFTFGITLGSSY